MLLTEWYSYAADWTV